MLENQNETTLDLNQVGSLALGTDTQERQDPKTNTVDKEDVNNNEDIKNNAKLDSNNPDSNEAEPKENHNDSNESEATTTSQDLDNDKESQDSPQLYKIKVGEDEIEVSEQELINGYHRQSDYSRKTQALAEERKKLEAERESFVKKKGELEKQYSQKLSLEIDIVNSQLKKEFGDIDWESLKEEDPQEYALKKIEYRERKEQLSEKQQELIKIQNDEAVSNRDAFIKHQTSEWEIFTQNNPDFKEVDNIKKLHQFMHNKGMNEQERASIADHRYFDIINKAMKYEEMIKKADVKAKKIANTPSYQKIKNQKPTKPQKSDLTSLISNGDYQAIGGLILKQN